MELLEILELGGPSTKTESMRMTEQTVRKNMHGLGPCWSPTAAETMTATTTVLCF